MSQIQETPYENMAFLYFVQGFIVVFYQLKIHSYVYNTIHTVTMFSDWSAIFLAIICVCVHYISN